MANVQATGLRRGMTILYEGSPCRVMEFEHRTPGNKRAFVQAKLRNLIDGTQRAVKFSSTDFVERAVIETREMDYLYADASGHVFMDAETFDQIPIQPEVLGEALPWLSEGMRILVEMLEGRPIGVQLPKTVEIEVSETEPVVKGQTAARSSKPATLSNGAVVTVPPFISAGDQVVVDPGELRYVERVK
jgi:elongation factor P